MLMPIVSLNKMAMNESVAGTCCYRHMASPTNVYWEVLNGGWIGNGYVDSLEWRHNAYKWWAVLPWEVSNLTHADNAAMVQFVPAGQIERVSWVNAAGDLVTQYEIGGTEVNLWLATVGATYPRALGRGNSCSHDSVDCAYREAKIGYVENRHFDSTAKHDTGGSAWAKPHEAKAFNS